MGWLAGWSKRQPITLTGGSDGAQTDFQLLLSIAYDSDMLSDFSDLRFTEEDGETLIDAWLEDYTDSTSADVWVEFPSTPANGETQTYYMYYGKSDALDYWDIGSTFLFGDDFEDGTISSSYTKYGSGTWEESGGLLTQTNPPSANEYVDGYAVTDRTFPTNYVIETKIKINSESGDGNDLTPRAGIAGRCRSSDGYGTAWMIVNFAADDDVAHLLDSIAWDTRITFNWELDTWYKLKSIFDGDDISSSIDNTNDTWSRSDQHAYPGYPRITGSVDPDNYILPSFDDFFVRKYTANPPTYEFGSEQNEPSGLSMAIVMHHLMQMRRS